MQSLSLTASSRNVYSSQVGTLFLACEAFDYDPYDLSEDELVDVVFFFALSRSTLSIDNFLTALGHFYASFDKKLPRSPPLKLLKLGLRRLFLSADAPSKAFPLGQEIIMLILSHLDRKDSTQLLFGAWMSISFVFALRPQDITSLRWKDIAFLSDGSFELSVLSKKGAKHRPSSLFSAPASDSILSPYLWFTHLFYLYENPPLDDHLVFAYRDVSDPDSFNKLIPRQVFSDLLRHYYKKYISPELPPRLTPYSLRRGGATAYYKAGVNTLHLSQMLRHKNFDTTSGYIDFYSASSSRQAFTAALLQPGEFRMP